MVDFYTESLTLLVNFGARGGASRAAFPGGTWERVKGRGFSEALVKGVLGCDRITLSNAVSSVSFLEFYGKKSSQATD
jgi:hypothetical protein